MYMQSNSHSCLDRSVSGTLSSLDEYYQRKMKSVWVEGVEKIFLSGNKRDY